LTKLAPACPDKSAVTPADPVAPFAATPAPPPPPDAGDLLAETIVPVTQLAKELGKNPATIYRWIQVGILLKDAIDEPTRQRLESFKLGAVTYTSREAFSRFVRRTQPTSAPALEPEPRRTTAPRRQRELAAVDAELVKAGL
jgi:hypothetical protein